MDAKYLIPNEDFVTQQVINWSYTSYRMMLKSSFGVSYDSDPHHVRAVAIAAAASVPRVLTDPPPTCYFEAFGDSSLDFSVRYWIDDPDNGIINVRESGDADGVVGRLQARGHRHSRPGARCADQQGGARRPVAGTIHTGFKCQQSGI